MDALPSPPSILDLPFDIRLIIYDYALCNQRIHLTPHGWSLRSMVCVAPVSETAPKRIHDICAVSAEPSHGCARRTLQLTSASAREPTWVKVPKLGVDLIRTCRQIYAESAHLVYARNTFMIHTLAGLYRFVQVVPAHHLELVKELLITNSLNGPDFDRVQYGAKGIQKPNGDYGMLFMINNMHAVETQATYKSNDGDQNHAEMSVVRM